jgi:hypothetical protein
MPRHPRDPSHGDTDAKDLSEIWTDAQTYRSQLLRSRMQCHASDDDRAVYGKWRRGVIVFYGLLALLFLATGTIWGGSTVLTATAIENIRFFWR